MTRARYQQVSLHDTPYYHCISRCVRRAYLCGYDPVTGKNFDHRKQWLVSRIKTLGAQFSIDICAYAIMSNHYHLVLFVNEQQAREWDDAEVVKRRTALFPRNAALVATLQKNNYSKAASRRLQQQISLWRERLMDISWFMRCVNETVAR
jgi:putative transposase